METIGSLEAKTHFAEILERASKGETIVITRHGKPLAKLVPMPEDQTRMSVDEAVEGLLEFRKKHPLPTGELLQWIREGRKH